MKVPLNVLMSWSPSIKTVIFRSSGNSLLFYKYHDSIVNSFRYVTASESGRCANKLRRLSSGPVMRHSIIFLPAIGHSHTALMILNSHATASYGHTEKTHLFWLFPNQLLKYITIPAKNAVRTKKANTDQTTLHTIWTTRKGDVHRIYFLWLHHLLFL